MQLKIHHLKKINRIITKKKKEMWVVWNKGGDEPS
jgi:hypothetical protein